MREEWEFTKTHTIDEGDEGREREGGERNMYKHHAINERDVREDG